MTDDIWRRDEPDSPCRNVCLINPASRLCLGCHRTIDEITDWPAMTPERRRTLLQELPNRDPGTSGRRGGRRARRPGGGTSAS